MTKIILILFLFTSGAICQTGEWKYIDGWVFTSKTNDATAGGAIIQRKKENKEQKYNTINGERYVTTEEWKKITNYEEQMRQMNEHTCLVIWSPDGGFFHRGPEPSAGGLFQLGLVICFYLNRLWRKV